MIIYYFTEAINSIRRAKFASLISVNTIALAILFTLFSFFIIFFSGSLENRVKNKIEIILFIRKGLNKAEIDDIKNEVSKINYSSRIRFVSEKAAAKEFIEKTGEDFSGLLNNNPLPASFRVKIKKNYLTLENIDNIKSRYSKIKGITDVIFDFGFVLKILKFIASAKVIIYLISLTVVLIAVYFVYSTSYLQIKYKMREYEIMKLVGASLNAVKIPILISGLLLGVISGILSAAAIFVITFAMGNIYSRINPAGDYLFISVLVFLIGIFYGILGSYFSIKKISWN